MALLLLPQDGTLASVNRWLDDQTARLGSATGRLLFGQPHDRAGGLFGVLDAVPDDVLRGLSVSLGPAGLPVALATALKGGLRTLRGPLLRGSLQEKLAAGLRPWVSGEGVFRGDTPDILRKLRSRWRGAEVADPGLIPDKNLVSWRPAPAPARRAPLGGTGLPAVAEPEIEPLVPILAEQLPLFRPEYLDSLVWSPRAATWHGHRYGWSPAGRSPASGPQWPKPAEKGKAASPPVGTPWRQVSETSPYTPPNPNALPALTGVVSGPDAPTRFARQQNLRLAFPNDPAPETIILALRALEGRRAKPAFRQYYPDLLQGGVAELLGYRAGQETPTPRMLERRLAELLATMDQPLTYIPKDKELAQFVATYKSQVGRPPTEAEIVDLLRRRRNWGISRKGGLKPEARAVIAEGPTAVEASLEDIASTKKAVDPGLNPLDMVIARQTLSKAMAQLPERTQTAFLLREGLGGPAMSDKEVASLLGVSPSRARGLVGEAVEALRQQLALTEGVPLTSIQRMTPEAVKRQSPVERLAVRAANLRQQDQELTRALQATPDADLEKLYHLAGLREDAQDELAVVERVMQRMASPRERPRARAVRVGEYRTTEAPWWKSQARGLVAGASEPAYRIDPLTGERRESLAVSGRVKGRLPRKKSVGEVVPDEMLESVTPETAARDADDLPVVTEE